MSAWSTVWITGASRGIGAALALEFASRGCTVAISARSADDLQQLAEQAQSLGLPGKLVPFALDVTDAAACREAVTAIETELGAIDLALLNAGTHRPVTLAEFSPAPYLELMQLNYFGVVNGVAALLPQWRARGTGHLAIVASVAGYRGLPTASAYGASKAALINFAEALQPEFRQQGLALSLVNPGFVRTPLTDRNDFPMPFLLEADDAARRIVRGLEKNRFEIAFPWRFVFWLKLMRLLPYRLYFPLVTRMTRT
ncbi:oxidoreductase [Marinobacterium nitratireducens]|uniref:Oxidoreductase n=1 Tax=Marinobacterium nitratireducens TaxID=518897 RepID=A0A917ZBJ2_9GAMM|nr:SDR family NAD(P)-dependent oxidoreductase [Marinobacterium nitratireducens]GGO79756.1 oxidoreductase [Marinobacterium nitratireducens]